MLTTHSHSCLSVVGVYYDGIEGFEGFMSVWPSWYTHMPFSLTGRTVCINVGIKGRKGGVCKNITRERCPGQHTKHGK